MRLMDTPRTTSSFLEGLAKGDEQAWAGFCSRYEPVVRAVARRCGLDDADQHDAVQETFMAFLPAFREGKYDRSRGRLRHYLGGIAVNKVRQIVRSPHRRRRQAPGGSESGCGLDWIPDESEIASFFDEEWKREILQEVYRRLRSEIGERAFQVFMLYAVERKSADEVASLIGIERATVYVHKNRALASLRELRAERPDLAEEF